MVAGIEGLRGFEVESRPVDDEDERENVDQENVTYELTSDNPYYTPSLLQSVQ
jgi:hypothetical protein